MKKAIFNDEGFPAGFFCDELHGKNIPANAIEITDAQWEEFINNMGLRKWLEGEIVTVEPSTAPATITDYENAIQQLIEETAQSKQYDTAANLASYVASTVPVWAAQAQTFVAWRDAVWQYTYQQLEQFQLGLIEQPSVADFLEELPTIDWNEQ